MINYLSLGFQFRPTRKELLFSYLMNKILGNKLPWNGVKEINLYGDQSPWELFNENDIDTWHSETNKNTQVLYCFTRLKRLKNGTKNYVRTGGCGQWDGESCERFNEGCMKMFKFKPTLPLDEEGPNVSWLMHEYSLSRKILKEINHEWSDYVICKITRREEKRNNQDFPDARGSVRKRKSAEKDDAITRHQHQQESKVARFEPQNLVMLLKVQQDYSYQEHVSYQPNSAAETKEEYKLQPDEQYVLETDHVSTLELFTTLMNGVQEQNTCQHIQEKSTFPINGLQTETVVGHDEKTTEDTKEPLLVGKAIPMSEAGLWMEIDEIQALDMFNKL
ncbi:hypothetical protein LIER_32357 [Lithospermum erythrorhizon]|uniref:NAC domain-containing protein n=1 Tax=Lithospermum erythrorhizon TaxID=34254 RepID=A0AAV3RVT8_LITER